ncbi:DNA-binding transcriptional ArsR family regulator [Paenibacillus mucilaginosus]|uniref:ArsR/SmtB family transcription factor n=1 Tax=Paenibacillus mucilaginosus TaxID=61624 RepID=UPI003D1B3EE5
MSKKIPDMDIKTLNALAEPNRMNIVELLRDGPLTVGEIAKMLGLHQPQASKHLKVLSDNGILEVKAEGNRRIYKLRSEPFQELGSWVKSFRRIMEERFDNLEDYLWKLQNKEKSKIIQEELQCQTAQ